MDKEMVGLIIDFVKKTAEYETACHENVYHLDSDCTPVKEHELMERAEHRLISQTKEPK